MAEAKAKGKWFSSMQKGTRKLLGAWAGLCESGEAPQTKVSHWVGLDPGHGSCSFCQKTGYFP